jgi:hypothetical protein
MRRRLAALILAITPHLAHAGEVARDVLNLPLKQYALVLGMSLLGGFAGWYAKVRRGELSSASLFSLIGEMATSALAGLGAFFLCDHLQVPLGVTAAITGMAGYMGGRAVDLAERLLQARILRKFGSTGPVPLDDGKGHP